MNNYFAVFLNNWISLLLFVIEFLQQYLVLNLDQDTQLMLTVDYEAKRLVDVYSITLTEAQRIKSIISFFTERSIFF
ncbi:ATP-dependent Clp protease adaptor ClpS [Acinetobacter colistiniresistens]|uniref:ATP-dependent Clp protease adaptor ClpS n=1 Tax=Acinetobacter colistiniresistens TaxID=280145 RepID=UPI000A2F3C69